LDVISIINKVLANGIDEFTGVVCAPAIFFIKQIEVVESTYPKIFWCLTWTEATH